MRVNVDKVLDRDQKLSELDDRAGEMKQIHMYSKLWFYLSLFLFFGGSLVNIPHASCHIVLSVCSCDWFSHCHESTTCQFLNHVIACFSFSHPLPCCHY